MAKAKIITLVVLSILMVVIVAQNTETVETRILFFTVAMPRALLLMLTFVIGLIVGLAGAVAVVGRDKKSA